MNQDLPGFITINPSASKGGPRNYSNAFLPTIYQGTAVGRAGQPVSQSKIRNITNTRTSASVQRRQFDFLQSLNREQQRHDPLDDQLEATIEMKDATMGGLVMALGLTTHSHVCGLVHDTVTAYEIVAADGRLVRATADNEHADLFRALPWSHGTLGLLVALEMRVIPASSHVRLVYRPFYSLQQYADEFRRLASEENPPHFIETLIFGKDRAVLMEGHLATKDEVRAGQLPINPPGRYYQPLFYKHVESMLELGEGQRLEELVPSYDYLMRHDRSMCMCMAQILPSANEPWFRYTMGWMLPPNMTFLKGTRPEAERENTIRKQVWQEYTFPAEHFAEMVAHVHDAFEIYPLLAYPCKVIDRGGFVRLPQNRGKPYSGQAEHGTFVDIGVYGFPQRIKDGEECFPTVTKVRRLEQKARSLGGFLHTYCDVFSTEEEFNEMFDHTLWRQMREKYDADGAFPSIYDKVKPEMDPLQFLQEEQSWGAQENPLAGARPLPATPGASADKADATRGHARR